MGWRRADSFSAGDKVAVVSPVSGRRARGRLLGFRNGGRTARVQGRYDWRVRSVPTECVHHDH